MSEYKQQLSACLDGELSDDEIRRLQPEVEAAVFSTSCRYQVIGAAIRNDVEDGDLIDISDTVRIAVLQEQSYSTKTSAVKAGRARGFWWRPLGGMAVAASVALVMVITLTDEQSGADAQLASQASAIQVPLAAVPAPQPVVAVSEPVGGQARPVANLNTYLSEHSNSAARDTMQGRLPYARAVSYESK